MSRPDLLSNPHLANKLAEAQAKLAGSVAGRPGSHPHPRRVIKDLVDHEGSLTKVNEELYGKTPKPRNKRRSKQKDKPVKTRKRPAEASDRRSVVDEAGGAADSGGGIHPGEETKIEPCEKCQTNEQCDGGPFCGCDCHDGLLSIEERRINHEHRLETD